MSNSSIEACNPDNYGLDPAKVKNKPLETQAVLAVSIGLISFLAFCVSLSSFESALAPN